MATRACELVFADRQGKVYNYPGLRPAGMKAGKFFPLDEAELVPVPDAAELFLLPDRSPVGLDEAGRPVVLERDPSSKKDGPCQAVAAFLPPGYTLTHSAAYAERAGAKTLPLFAYGACVYSEGKFWAAAVRIDEGVRHDERFLDMDAVQDNVERYRKLFPKNRLLEHLVGCATVNGCANAKNFFLGRFEAPVPVSAVCNAQCQGCISLQPENRDFPSTQKRIAFKPTAQEIVELVLHHFDREPDPIVSFGQGCEGEPTLAADVIEEAIRLIRRKTSKGAININTNAGRPQALERLLGAGLTNVRVSLNSVREPYYSRYYQPKGYSFKEVAESVRTAKRLGGFVSLNYLSMPGFTDSAAEFEALSRFVGETGVDMIQWRNLNYDPLQYFRDLGLNGETSEFIGVAEAITRLRHENPALRMGYFNPTLN